MSIRYVTTDKKVIRLSRRRAGGVHRKKIVSGQLLAFPLRRGDHVRPVVLGDSPPLLPLADLPMILANVSCKLGNAFPAPEKVVEGFHGLDNATDNSSAQARIEDPMIKNRPNRTIRPMGRGRTPHRVVNEICARTEAARRMAGYDDQAAFAQLMGIKPDTYARYEQRVPLPHRYLTRFVELTGADLNVVLTGRAQGQIRKAI